MSDNTNYNNMSDNTDYHNRSVERADRATERADRATEKNILLGLGLIALAMTTVVVGLVIL